MIPLEMVTLIHFPRMQKWPSDSRPALKAPKCGKREHPLSSFCIDVRIMTASLYTLHGLECSLSIPSVYSCMDGTHLQSQSVLLTTSSIFRFQTISTCVRRSQKWRLISFIFLLQPRSPASTRNASCARGTWARRAGLRITSQLHHARRTTWGHGWR